MEKIKIQIKNMHCSSCASLIEEKLEKEKGIKGARVNYESQIASVAYNREEISKEEIVKLIEDSGYVAEEVDRNEIKREERDEKNSWEKYSIPAAIVFSGLFIAVALFISSTDDSLKEETRQEEIVQPTEDPRPVERPAPQREVSIDLIEIEGWPYLGSMDAPIVMVEYSDYACPFCGRFAEETLPLLKRDYIDTGKVRFVYKDFAIIGGEKAAEAAHCAEEQGKYWEYHDILFENLTADRARWSDVSVHRGYASEIGLNVNSFASCFESGKYQAKVSRSTEEAIRMGGQGTPFFIINDREISGAQPYSSFREVLDSLL